MLERCQAHLIAGDERQTRLLQKVARAAGFGSCDPLHPLEPASKISYFLVHFETSLLVKTSVLKIVRRSDDEAVCFSPIIVIANDCPFDMVLDYIKLGFDDVVSLPDKRPSLTQRFESQVNSSHIYFQTTNYLGPDRRRMEAVDNPHENRGTGNAGFVRILLRRDVHAGVHIQRTIVGTQDNREAIAGGLRELM